jgi:hypothetical protein
MFSARVREKSIAMTRHTHVSLVVAMLILLFTAPSLWAVPFGQTKIIIEVNATAGDAGIQVSVDATGWNRLQVFDPNGQKIVDITGNSSVGQQGITELFFESAEPSLAEQSLNELFARFPEGVYKFVGTTVDGKKLTGSATFKHNIPAGPVILAPVGGTANAPVIIEWQQVSDPFPGTALAVNVIGYQVIVERVKPQPLRVFSVDVGAAATQVTVPPEFLEANAEYNFEVLAIEASGNQTISEGSFTTAAP